MSEPVKLVTKKVTVADSVIEEAERILAEAKAGRINSIVAVARLNDGGWTEYRSGAMSFPEMVGMIELAKLSWATDYLRDAVRSEPPCQD